MTTDSDPEKHATSQPSLWIRRVLVVGGLLVITLALFAAALLVQPSLRKKVRDLRFAAERPFATYDNKMHLQMGIAYDYVVFVRAHMPESGVILVAPPTYSPPQLGNVSIVRYFIYPRDAVHQDQAGRATHAMLVPGWRPDISSTIPTTLSWGLIDLTTGQVAWMEAEPESP